MYRAQSPAQTVVTPEHDLSPYLPDPKVMTPVHALASVLFRPHVRLERGAGEDLARHKEAGGSLLILMSHFSRWEVLLMADIANKKSLRHLRLETGITARKELFDLPYGAGYVVRHSGAHRVGRSIESPGETPEEKRERKAMNRNTQALGTRFLANGYHWLIFPEGGSKKIVTDEEGRAVIENGKVLREEREPDTLLPFQTGFVDTLDALTPEEKERVKILGIVAHYGKRRLAQVRPTIVVTRPIAPVEGTTKENLDQAYDLMSRAHEQAVRLDSLRR